MFAMTPSFLLCISLFFLSSDAAFNQINNQPDHCCPLKLEKYVLGEKFPDDTIFVHNDVTGENWAYAVGENNYYFYMSEDRQHAIDWVMDAPYNCFPMKDFPASFDVLSNPNKCVYGYEETRYPSQAYHNDSTLSAELVRLSPPMPQPQHLEAEARDRNRSDTRLLAAAAAAVPFTAFRFSHGHGDWITDSR